MLDSVNPPTLALTNNGEPRFLSSRPRNAMAPIESTSALRILMRCAHPSRHTAEHASEGRKCREASLDSRTEGRPLAQGYPGPIRLGCDTREGHLLARSISANQEQARTQKGGLAVAASMLTAIYFMLRDGTEYRDLGPDHFDKLDKTKTVTRLLRRLHDLGRDVEVKKAA
jgi:hypothetical protein